MITKSGIAILLIAIAFYLSFIYLSAKAMIECERNGGIYFKNFYGLMECSKK